MFPDRVFPPRVFPVRVWPRGLDDSGSGLVGITYAIGLGASWAGLTLQAQLITTAGTPYGLPISAGFRDWQDGWWDWTGQYPDDFRGALTFRRVDTGDIGAVVALSPDPLELSDTRLITVAWSLGAASGGLPVLFAVLEGIDGTETALSGVLHLGGGHYLWSGTIPYGFQGSILLTNGSDLSSAYTWGAVAINPPPPPISIVPDPGNFQSTGRGRDVYRHIQSILIESNLFTADSIRMAKREEVAKLRAQSGPMAVLVHMEDNEVDLWGDEIGGSEVEYTGSYSLMVLARKETELDQSELVDRVSSTIRNTLQNVSLAGLTLPLKTRIKKAKYSNVARHPELCVEFSGEFVMLIPGFENHNVDD